MAAEELTALRRLAAVGGIVLMSALPLAACDDAADGGDEVVSESEEGTEEEMSDEEMDEESMEGEEMEEDSMEGEEMEEDSMEDEEN